MKTLHEIDNVMVCRRKYRLQRTSLSIQCSQSTAVYYVHICTLCIYSVTSVANDRKIKKKKENSRNLHTVNKKKKQN